MEQWHLLHSLPDFSHSLRYSQSNWAPLVLIPEWGACVHSRALWVSPKNSFVRLGVPLAAPSPTGFFQPEVLAFISQCWNPGLRGLSHSPVFSLNLSTHKCGTACSASYHLVCSGPPPQLPISAPPTGLDECFFFNSLVVRLLYSSVIWQFWLFFVFKFVAVLLLVV